VNGSRAGQRMTMRTGPETTRNDEITAGKGLAAVRPRHVPAVLSLLTNGITKIAVDLIE
jgi:hypothetical protein